MNEAIYMGFESYLNNEMPADERKDFEQKLRNDAALGEKFALYKQTTQFLQHKFSAEAADFRQNLKNISGAHFSGKEQKQPKVIALKTWYYAVAACVAVVFGTLLFNQDNPQYSDFSQHETAFFTERSNGDANLKLAQDYFNAHDYKKAAVAFEKMPTLTNPELQYYYAIALIETDSYQKAAMLLNNVRKGTSVYKDKATWYLALSNLKQQKLEQTKALLQQIPADADDYEKAQELLDDLD